MTDQQLRRDAADLPRPILLQRDPHDDLVALAVATPDDVGLAARTPFSETVGGPLLGTIGDVPNAPATPKLDMQTPATELPMELMFAAAVVGHLPLEAGHTSLEGPAGAIRHALKLPSFEALGIAAPHPDRPITSPGDSLLVGSGPLSKPGDPLHLLSPMLQDGTVIPRNEDPLRPSGDINSRHVTHFVPTFTPPEELGSPAWPASFAQVATSAMESPAYSDPERPPADAGQSHDREGDHHPTAAEVTIQPSLEVHTKYEWLERALQVMFENMSDTSNRDSLKLLSHALPVPSPTGHAFPLVINRVLERIAPPQATWINVFHAVPGRFSLQELPTSPPNTPGSVVGGEDYFTAKVFDTAVAVPDYEAPATPLPASPRPVVPPGSIDISIIERYIPPSTPNEVRALFDGAGRSLLCDRLTELSSTNGLLLFIYPTRTGAKTFMSDYLGPILEPLLRSMSIINNLSADLGASLHQMTSIPYLAEFTEVQAQLTRFCARLSTTADSLSRFHPDRQTKYSLVYSAREEVVLSRDVWAADWFVKQEKPRIRATVKAYLRGDTAAARTRDADIVPTALIQEILEGVTGKANPGAKQPERGIEVGVYVIQKSS